MTNLTFDRVAHGSTASSSRTATRPSGLLRGLRRRGGGSARPTVAALSSSALREAAASPAARGCLQLTLHDGVPRLYLLDPHDFVATTSPEVAYDARVHAAYLLTLQGHRPEWLAQHLDLPSVAARCIAEHAERSGPDGPGTPPPPCA